LSNHLGNVLVTISDKKLAVADPNNANLIAYYNADVVTANDYYPFGSQMPGRKYSQPNSSYRYGFNGKENDNSAGEGNLDFGARIMDVRLGRWLSTDELEKKYPSFSPYVFAINSPLRIIDIDGKDIIILSAPKGAGGLGHAAVLIGSDKTGWTLYSKNGTYGSSGVISSGPDNNNPEAGVYVGSLSEFANSKRNFHHGKVQYTAAFKISSSTTTLKNVTSDQVDGMMKAAALKQVNAWYDVTGMTSGSCINVPIDALKAGGFNDGENRTNGSSIGGWGGLEQVGNVVPNNRYAAIVKANVGTNVSNQILPSEASKAKYKKEEEDNVAAEEAKKITVEKVISAVSPGGLQAAVNKIVQFLSTPR
jgi:RHS repeat-associated protein